MAGRLWFVSEIYHPDETSTGYVVTRLAEHAALSRKVDVLCGFPRYDSRGTRAAARESRNGVEIHRCAATNFSKDSIPGRIANIVSVTASLALRALLSLEKGDTTVVMTNPPLMPFLISLIGKAKGARVVLLIHDLYPDSLIAGRMIAPNGFAARVFHAMNRWLYARVEAIGVCGRDMQRIVVGRIARGSASVGLVCNWGDSETVSPCAKSTNPLLRELGIQDRFIAQYAGNMGRLHDIDMLLKAAKDLLALGAEVQFLFIGSGSQLPLLQRIVEKEGLTNVTVVGPMPRAEQTMFLNACDVAITAFVPGMRGVGVPSRLYNVLAAGKPWIAAVDLDSEIGLVILEEQAGWVVPPGDTKAFVGAIVAAASDPGRIAQMGARARRAAVEKHNFGATADALERLLAPLGENG